MKLSKMVKKVIAFVCAVAMVVTGLTYTPVKVSADTSWISVAGVPSGAWGGKKEKYQLGTTTDYSADGKWYLEVSQNEWGNWAGRYKNADAVEGFTFQNRQYNNAGGVFLWSTDLKTEYGLTAGQAYDMSVTIDYTNVEAAQHNFVLTEGGSSNMDFSRTVTAGSSQETYTAEVCPRNDKQFVLRISWASARYETAEKGTFQVTDITFTPKEATTLAPGFKSVTAEVGQEAVKGTEGYWNYTVLPGDSWDVTATFGNCNTVNGFKATLSKYCWAGSYWKMTNLKAACLDTDGDALVANQTYTCTVTIKEESNGRTVPPVDSTEEPQVIHTPITVSTSGGLTNLASTTKTCQDDEDLVWTGTVVPSQYDLLLSIGYGNDGGAGGLEGQAGSFTVKSVVFEKAEAETMPANYASVTAVGASGAKPVKGTEGLWSYTIVPGDNGQTGAGAEYWDVNATFGACNTVEGFKATLSKYCFAGSYWKVNNLKAACKDTDGDDLEADQAYTCTITIKEESNGKTTPAPDSTELPQTIHTPITLSTSGGTTNLASSTKTSQNGENLVWTGTVVPSEYPLVLSIGYGNDGGATGLEAQAGSFTVQSVVFEKTEAETMPENYASVTAVGASGAKPVKGTKGLWSYTIVPGDNGETGANAEYWDVNATFGACNTVNGFKATLSKYCFAGSYWKVNDLKQGCLDTDGDELAANQTYDCTITIKEETNATKKDDNGNDVPAHTPITISTSGGLTNLASSTKTSEEGEDLVWTGKVVPSQYPLVLSLGYGNDGGATGLEGQAGSFTVKSITFTKTEPETMPENYASVTAVGAAGAGAVSGDAGIWSYTIVPGDNGLTGDAAEYWDVNATFGPYNAVNGFKATFSKYCFAGSYWKVNNLKSVCKDTDGDDLEANQAYRCTLTIKEETNATKKDDNGDDVPLHTPITVSTSGCYANLPSTTKTSQNGEDLVWTGTVIPSEYAMLLSIGYGNDGGAGGLEGQAGSFTVKSITFEKSEPETMQANYKSVTAVGAAGAGAISGTEGFWTYTVVPGGNGVSEPESGETQSVKPEYWDVTATFGPCNSVKDFTATLSKYCWIGSYWKVNNLKAACKDTDGNNLKPDSTYRYTIIINESTAGNIHTPITLSTTGGYKNIAKSTKTGETNNEDLVWTGTIVPSGQDLVLSIGYGNDGGENGLEGQAGSFTVKNIVFEKIEEETPTGNNISINAPAGASNQGSYGVWSWTLLSGADENGNAWDVPAEIGPCNTIDGFRAEINGYSWDGSYWSASDLKQVYGLVAGNVYDCTITIRPLCTEKTDFHVSTSGGSINVYDDDMSGKVGDTLVWEDQVQPNFAPMQLNIGYGNKSNGTVTGGGVGGFEVVSIDFDLVYTAATACTIGSQSTAGVWTYTVAQNANNNQQSSYEKATAVKDFVYNHQTYSEDGANWTASDLKSIYNLTEGETYNCTVTLKPLCHNETNIHVGTSGGATNLADTDKTGSSMSKLTWSGEVVPSSAPLKLNIGYGNNTNGEGTGAEIGGFKVVDVSFTKETLSAPKSVALYNFYVVDGGYQLVFVPTYSGAASYNLYVDNSETPLMNIPVSNCKVLDTNKNVYTTNENFDASVFSTYANNAIHNVYLTTVDAQGNESAKSKAAPIRINSASARNAINNHPTDISRVYVTTNTATNIDTLEKAASKQDAALSIVSADTAIIKNATYYGTIKLRGNSTSFADKKAYNISFNTKQKVMTNAGKGKKWSLLANAYEKTLIRNKLAMDFGRLMGNVATPEEHYVDVYLNGAYKGTYVLSEPAENGRAGVSYDEDNDEVLFEYEGGRDETAADGGVAYYTTSKYRVRFVNEEFEDEVNEIYADGATTADAITNYMKKYNPKFKKWTQALEKFETALQDTASTDYADYIDEDSFVDMYIINELFKTVDFTYSSVKFYVTYDAETGAPTIHAGPLWDFDLSSGNAFLQEVRSYNENPLRGQTNPWFGALMKNPVFAAKVKARFLELQPQIQNLYKDNSQGTNKITQNYNEVQASRIRNYSTAGWDATQPDSYDAYAAQQDWGGFSYSTVSPYNTYTYDQHVEYLRDWLENRNEYLAETWEITLPDTGDEPTTEEQPTEEPTTKEPVTEEPTTTKPEVDPNFVISKKQLALTNGLRFYLKADKTLFTSGGYTDPRMVIEFNNGETVVEEYVEEAQYYAFPFNEIAPHQMGMNFSATLHAYKNGVEYVSPALEYSVAQYCYDVFDAYKQYSYNQYAKLYTLLVDLLNYGAQAQIYTNTDTDNLVNANLTTEQQSHATTLSGNFVNSRNYNYETISNPSVTWQAAALNLRDSIVMRLRFAAKSTDGLVVKARDDKGNEWEIDAEAFESAGSGTYNVYFDQFNVGRMSDIVYLTVYNGDTPVSNTCSFSIESYAAVIQQNASTYADLNALTTAMMKYGKAAKAYTS